MSEKKEGKVHDLEINSVQLSVNTVIKPTTEEAKKEKKNG